MKDGKVVTSKMTITISNLKITAAVSLIAGVFSILYMDAPDKYILGIVAYKFLAAIANAANGVGLLMARQNNQSSEQVGAGVIPPSNVIPNDQLVKK